MESGTKLAGRIRSPTVSLDLGDRREGILEEEMEAFVQAFKQIGRAHV